MRRRLPAVVLGSALVAAACGGGGGSEGRVVATAPPATVAATTTTVPPASTQPVESADGASDPADTAPPETTAVPVPVPSQLSFVGPAVVGGGEIDLSVYAGTDTIAWFWAPW